MINLKRPIKCCQPDCFKCPYVDCRYDRLEVEDYTESNKRDYELYEAYTGNKLNKPSDKEYTNKRKAAYHRRSVKRHEYNKRYYEMHKEEIKKRAKENYDAEQNAEKCKKYRQKHKKEKQSYDKAYYELNKERIKEMARQRYYKKKRASEVS